MRLSDPENESHFHTKEHFSLYNFQHMHIKLEKNDSIH